VLAARHKRGIAGAVREVTKWFGDRGISTLLLQEQASLFGLPKLGAEQDRMAEDADLMLAMGGDGTLLATARIGSPRGRPILGVNFGGFGFLAAIPRAQMLEGLAEVLEGRFQLEMRMMLSASVIRDGQQASSFTALNDVVVGKGAFSRLFRLKTSISGEPVSDFPADGMIVSTPTGSTGYSLSSGGPVVDPGMRLLVVTPICAHALSARTLVVPAGEVVEIVLPDPRGEEVLLTADGQEGFSLRAGDRVEIREAEFSAKLVGLADASFYSKLRGKLGWGSQR
jgi:NAD+ kinase